MIEEKKKDDSIYINYETGNVIIARKNENDSYTFYATYLNEEDNYVDISSLQPIDDIFDYIEKNNLDINVLSKKIEAVGEKKNGK